MPTDFSTHQKNTHYFPSPPMKQHFLSMSRFPPKHRGKAFILCAILLAIITQLPETPSTPTKWVPRFSNYQSPSLDNEFSIEASKMRFNNRISRVPRTPGHQYTISVVTAATTKHRFLSLVRLCDSLVNADYAGYTNIRLIFNIDVGTSADVVEYATSFSWPHGSKSIHRRVKKGGLVTAVAECWYPSSPEDHGIILEDDIEVSPYFFRWLLNALKAHYADPDPRVVGISLYTPRTVEHIVGRARFRIDPSKIYRETMYGQPLPCSWGALWLPSAWTEFLAYMSTRLEAEEAVSVKGTTVSVPGSLTMYWARSWKKYMMEIMYTKDYYMIYPNFPYQTSFSTNHVELGEHITSEKEREKRLADFTVPLFQESSFEMLKREFGLDDPLSFLPTLRNIRMLDIHSRPMIDVNCFVDEECTQQYPPQVPSPSTATKLWSTRRDHVCQDIPFNDNYLMKDSNTLTLVIDSGPRCDMPILVKQLEYYSKSSTIAAIVVIWNDRLRATPPSVDLGNTFVTFLPQFQSSRNNRYNPSSKIITDGVIIMELGIRVHLDDITEAHKLWEGHKNNIVGFSPIISQHNDQEYIGIKSNVMVLHSSFLKMYSCDEGTAYAQYQVDRLDGYEDLAMSMLVSAVVKDASPLVLDPMHRLIRFADRHEPKSTRLEASTNIFTEFFFHSSITPTQKLKATTLLQTGDVIKTKTKLQPFHLKGGSKARRDELSCVYDGFYNKWSATNNYNGGKDEEEESLETICKSGWDNLEQIN